MHMIVYWTCWLTHNAPLLTQEFMSSNHDMMIVMSVTICPSSEDDIHPDVI